MTSFYTNVLTSEEVHYLNNLPEVLTAKASLDSRASGKVYFSVAITDSIRATLQSRFGLDLSAYSSIPMRWIKGDTRPHVDVGASNFQNTYLLYLNDSPGELIVDAQTYPIQANSGLVFNEGLSHETRSTVNIPRLLLGPMNEFAEPVGGPSNTYDIQISLPAPSNLVVFNGYFIVDNLTNIVQNFYDSTDPNTNILSNGNTGGPSYLYEPGWLSFDSDGCNITNFPHSYGTIPGDYNMRGDTTSSTGNIDGLGTFTFKFYTNRIDYYPTEADALADTNSIGNTGSFVVGYGYFGPYTSWRIASNSFGSSSQSIVYSNGDILETDGHYFLYPTVPCFLEGTTILCQVEGVEKYVPVEELRKDTLVKTSLHGFKKVFGVGKGTIQNPGDDSRIENRLYKCSPSKYPELKNDLYMTGCHSILEFPITDKQKEDTIKHLGKLFVTDKKYRLMACVDERAEPWNSEGTYTIWHFALENDNEKMNYGVYANGLLVETCTINYLKNKSNLSLI